MLNTADQPGVYSVSFPDIPGCDTFGTGLREAFENAQDALEGYLDVEMQQGSAIPAPSNYADAKVKAEAYCRELDIAMPDGTLYQLVPAEVKPLQPVRLNITMHPSRLLKKSEAAFFKEVWRKRGFAKPTEILLSLFVKFPVADSRRLHSPFFNGLLECWNWLTG